MRKPGLLNENDYNEVVYGIAKAKATYMEIIELYSQVQRSKEEILKTLHILRMDSEMSS
jgi:hypothetical protein